MYIALTFITMFILKALYLLDRELLLQLITSNYFFNYVFQRNFNIKMYCLVNFCFVELASNTTFTL